MTSSPRSSTASRPAMFLSCFITAEKRMEGIVARLYVRSRCPAKPDSRLPDGCLGLQRTVGDAPSVSGTVFHEQKIAGCPQPRGNAAARPRGQDDVVIIGDRQRIQNGSTFFGFHQRQVA